MKERPILFKEEMVQAILEERKTQTWRTSKLESINLEPASNLFKGFVRLGESLDLHAVFVNKFAEVTSTIKCPYGKPGDQLWVRESMYMPRLASRITLEIKNIQVGRLNDIGQFDAGVEGVQSDDEGSWDQNPWVWVVEFERLLEQDQ